MKRRISGTRHAGLVAKFATYYYDYYYYYLRALHDLSRTRAHRRTDRQWLPPSHLAQIVTVLHGRAASYGDRVNSLLRFDT